MCFLRDECCEIYIFIAITDQALDELVRIAADGQRLIRRAPEGGQRYGPAC
jgi:hypothetical protein